MNRKAAPCNPHLAERIDRLSLKRQEIIRPILEHPREFVPLSVRAMATRLQTDPATIVPRARLRQLPRVPASFARALAGLRYLPGHHAIRRPRGEQTVARTRLSRAGLEKPAGPQKQSRRTAPRRVGKTLLRGPSDRSARRRPGSSSRALPRISDQSSRPPGFLPPPRRGGSCISSDPSISRTWSLPSASDVGFGKPSRGPSKHAFGALIASVSLTPMFLPWHVNVT